MNLEVMSKVVPSSPLTFSEEIDSSFKSNFQVELLRLVPQSRRTFQLEFFFLFFFLLVFLGICQTVLT